MVIYESWFTPRNQRVQINSITIYKDLSSEIITKLNSNLSVSEIVNWLREETTRVFREKYSRNPETGSLNNASGRWNEFIATSMFSEIALDFNKDSDYCIIIFQLPNSGSRGEKNNQISSRILNLFNHDEFSEGKILTNLNFFKNKIFMPSPDYIISIINNPKLFNSVLSLLEKQVGEPDSLEIYNFLAGKLDIDEVKAAISLKTSNRSDRRYQPLFEAAMIKAISYALHQDWKYYMVASELTSADRTIFDTAIAPHGLIIGQDLKLVDGTYLYSDKSDLFRLVQSVTNLVC